MKVKFLAWKISRTSYPTVNHHFYVWESDSLKAIITSVMWWYLREIGHRPMQAPMMHCICDDNVFWHICLTSYSILILLFPEWEHFRGCTLKNIQQRAWTFFSRRRGNEICHLQIQTKWGKYVTLRPLLSTFLSPSPPLRAPSVLTPPCRPLHRYPGGFKYFIGL